MSRPSSKSHPIAAKPTRTPFDAWNSSSTGHQRAENRLSGSTSWRDSRTIKLGEQFKSGHGGGKRLYDTVGAGAENFGKDGRLENGGWEVGAPGLRGRGQMSLGEAFGGIGVVKAGVDRSDTAEKTVVDRTTQESYEAALLGEDEVDDGLTVQRHSHIQSNFSQQGQLERENQHFDQVLETEEKTKINDYPQVFANLTIYINGSTAPTISDHKLKRLLVSHGANLSIALGRRTVTHVILGHSNNSSHSGRGAGGGLAASKIQKEIANVRGKGVKFVSVEWVLESIKVGKRAPESKFEALRLAPKGVKSVAGMFAAQATSKSKDAAG